MKEMKQIYQLGLEAAAKLDSWVFVGIAPKGTKEACRAAIDAAADILPGIALSETLTLAEAYLEEDESVVPVPGQTKCLFTAVAEELRVVLL